jgi:hypothetical protein
VRLAPGRTANAALQASNTSRARASPDPAAGPKVTPRPGGTRFDQAADSRSVATVTCGQLRPLKSSSTVWLYCNC